MTISTDEQHPSGNTYDKYGSKNPIARALFNGFMNSLYALLPPPAEPPSRIVEVGCGEGHLLNLVHQHYGGNVSCVGYDIDPQIIAEATTNYPALRFEVGNAEELKFPEGPPPLLLCCEVLEHVDDPARALERIATFPSERYIFSVPREPVWRVLNMARLKYVGQLGNTPGHINHWSQSAFKELVAKYFTVDSVQAPFPWTMLRARSKGAAQTR